MSFICFFERRRRPKYRVKIERWSVNLRSGWRRILMTCDSLYFVVNVGVYVNQFMFSAYFVHNLSLLVRDLLMAFVTTKEHSWSCTLIHCHQLWWRIMMHIPCRTFCFNVACIVFIPSHWNSIWIGPEHTVAIHKVDEW